MTTEEIKSLTQELNLEIANFLGHTPKIITVEMMKSHTIHGQCQRGTFGIKIKISDSLVKEEDILETIIHELCHVYAPVHAGHGSAWREIAAKVGKAYNIAITRCNSRQHTGTPLAYMVCPCCGRKSPIWGRNNRRLQHPNYYYCRSCGRKTSGEMKVEYTSSDE